MNNNYKMRMGVSLTAPMWFPLIFLYAVIGITAYFNPSNDIKSLIAAFIIVTVIAAIIIVAVSGRAKDTALSIDFGNDGMRINKFVQPSNFVKFSDINGFKLVKVANRRNRTYNIHYDCYMETNTGNSIKFAYISKNKTLRLLYEVNRRRVALGFEKIHVEHKCETEHLRDIKANENIIPQSTFNTNTVALESKLRGSRTLLTVATLIIGLGITGGLGYLAYLALTNGSSLLGGFLAILLFSVICFIGYFLVKYVFAGAIPASSISFAENRIIFNGGSDTAATGFQKGFTLDASDANIILMDVPQSYASVVEIIVISSDLGKVNKYLVDNTSNCYYNSRDLAVALNEWCNKNGVLLAEN